jgi:pimeloyl-ACP methyl ester carboxylesterase
MIKSFPAEVSTLRIDGYDVFYRLRGDGPTILCSEMPLNPFARFSLLEDELASRNQFCLIDLRPVIGASIKAPPAEDLLEFASDFSLRVADKLGIQTFYMMGSFMYGPVCMNIALKAANRVRGLVLIGSLGLVNLPASLLMKAIVKLYKLPGMPFLNRFYLIRALIENLDHAFVSLPRLKQIVYDAENSPVAIEDLYEQNKIPEYAAAQYELIWAIRKMNYAKLVPRLGEIKCPALIVHGAEDLWVPLKFAEELHALLSNSTLAVIPAARHSPEIDRPDLVLHHIQEFLWGEKPPLES